MEKTAIYGLSGNPPTLGHMQAVRGVLEKTDVEKIIISPSGDRLDKAHNIEHNYRRKLIETFIKVLQDSGLNVDFDFYFFEGKNGDITSTIEEEKYFRKKLGLSPSFIFGADVIPSMHKWVGNDDKFIEEKLGKIFINRPGYNFEPEKFSLDNFIFLDIPEILDVSSTVAREMIKNKESVSKIVSKEIIEVIEEYNMYGS